MAGAKLEIEIVDSGGSAVGGSAPPRAGVPSAPSPATASAGKSAPSKVTDASDDGPAVTSASEGAKKLANVLGLGGLTGATEMLTKAARDLSVVARGDAAAGRKPGHDLAARTAAAVGADSVTAPRQRPAIRLSAPKQPPKRRNPFMPAPITVHPPAPTHVTVHVPGHTNAASAAAPAFADTATKAATGLAQLAAAAGPAGLAVAGVVSLGIAAKGVADYLEGQARSLSSYSGILARQVARSDIRQQQSEMQRAQQLGPLLAKFENNRSQIQAQLYALGTRLMEMLLKFLNDAMPAISDAVKFFQVGIEIPDLIVTQCKLIIDAVLMLDDTEDRKTMEKIMRNIQDALADKQNDPILDDPFTKTFLEAFTHPINMRDPNGRRAPNMFPALAPGLGF